MQTTINTSPKFLRYLLWLLIIGCLCIIIFKLFYTILYGYTLNHVAGTWITLALDLSEGMFYRPLFTENIGFGGTRFFPLFFSLHALLIKLFGMPILSGHIISLFSGLLLFGACFIVLRQIKINAVMVIGLLTLLFSESSIQLGLTTVRGDILPVALNILGIACISNDDNTKYRILIASAFFVLAFSAKVTAINGILSVILWLIFNRKIKEALMITTFTSIGYILFLGILYLGTSGRIITIFSACSSGGADLNTVLKAPIIFIKLITRRDLICLLLLMWAFVVAYKHKKSLVNNVFFIFWFISIINTIVIFGSPGTDYNHLVDISTASVLLIGSKGSFSKSLNNRMQIHSFIIFVSICIICNLASSKSILADKDNRMAKRYPKEIIDLIREDDATIIAENPIFPLIADKRPYLLDSFMLRLIILNNDDIRSLTFNNINQKKYSAIIFDKNPLENIEGYSKAHFGYEFVQEVILNYKVGLKIDSYVVYFPDFSASN